MQPSKHLRVVDPFRVTVMKCSERHQERLRDSRGGMLERRCFPAPGKPFSQQLFTLRDWSGDLRRLLTHRKVANFVYKTLGVSRRISVIKHHYRIPDTERTLKSLGIVGDHVFRPSQRQVDDEKGQTEWNEYPVAG